MAYRIFDLPKLLKLIASAYIRISYTQMPLHIFFTIILFLHFYFLSTTKNTAPLTGTVTFIPFVVTAD